MAKKIEVDFRLLVAAIALVILATVGSAFATYLIFRSNPSSQATVDAYGIETRKEMGPTYDVGEFTLNLTAKNGNSPRFIRTEIVLETSDKKVVSQLEKRQPQIRDLMISLLRSQTAEQLNSENGMELLRFEIIQRMNALVSKGEVTDVFFIDLIVQ